MFKEWFRINWARWYHSQGWWHHHIVIDPRNKGQFPDSAFVTGFIMTGFEYLNSNRFGDYTNNFIKGLHSRLVSKTIWRDPQMIAEYKGDLNRDQWLAFYRPLKVIRPELAKMYYNEWREGWLTDFRKWLMPNHWLHFRVVDDKKTFWPIKIICELAEVFNIYSSVKKNDEDSLMHSGYRVASLIHLKQNTFLTKINYKTLSKDDVFKKAFEEFATRDIPGDAPGNHPPFHLIWNAVWDTLQP